MGAFQTDGYINFSGNRLYKNASSKKNKRKMKVHFQILDTIYY
jgi:hypothetical protein